MRASESLALVAKLADAFPRQSVSPQTAQVYAEFLQDLDLAEADKAIVELITESKWFPTISEIRGRVASAELGDRTGADAWADVLMQVGKVGYIGSPVFDDPRTAEAVRAIGWMEICKSDDSNLGIIRAQFRMAYESANVRTTRARNSGRLLEHAEEQRKVRGAKGPRMLGDIVSDLLPGD